MTQHTHTALNVLDTLGASVLSVGSLNADLTVTTTRLPGPGETVHGSDLKILPGGKSANQAATTALLGAQTTMIGALGTDGNGDLLLTSLADTGVDTSRILHRINTPTGTAIITVDDEAENTIVISAGANGTLSPDDLHQHAEAFIQARVLGLCFEIPYETVYEAARMAREAGTLVVLNVSPVREVPAELLALSDVLIVNEHELSVVCGREVDAHSSEAIAEAAQATGVRRVVVTLGGRGSLICEDMTVTSVPAFPVTPVDTTGAGDSFMGALMAGLAADASLTDAALLASAVSAYATTRIGAQSSYGSADDIRAYLTALN